jgi:alpha-methylacyl-CoA racemase
MGGKEMSGPLAGLCVIEMAGLGPCPLAGQLLADQGAEVTVIDRKPWKPDPTDVHARNKRFIALNLKQREGVDIALDLIRRADILIEGYRPGVMEKLGLDPETCLAANPRLIFGRMTGWGQEGPRAHTAGHDIDYLAISGALHAIGRDGEPPIPPLNLAADYGGGAMFLIFGVLAALFERGRSGKGQVVDAAMVDGVPAMMGLIQTFLARGMWSSKRESNLIDGGAPFYRCYETADGKFIAVGALEPQFFSELVQKAGLPKAHEKDRMDTHNWRARREEYAVLFRKKTRDQWVDIFRDSDACVAPVLDWSEVEHEPHNAARGVFLRVDGVLQAAPAPRFSRTPAASPKGAGGQESNPHEILAECGYSPRRIEELLASGAVVG